MTERGNAWKWRQRSRGKKKECLCLLHPAVKHVAEPFGLWNLSALGAQSTDGLQLFSRSFIFSWTFLAGGSLPAVALTLTEVCILHVAGLCHSYMLNKVSHALPGMDRDRISPQHSQIVILIHLCCACILVMLGNAYFTQDVYFRHTFLLVLCRSRNWMYFVFGAKLPRKLMKWGDSSEAVFHVEWWLLLRNAWAQNDMCCQLHEHLLTDHGSYAF